jgi:hypothetical protein
MSAGKQDLTSLLALELNKQASVSVNSNTASSATGGKDANVNSQPEVDEFDSASIGQSNNKATGSHFELRKFNKLKCS